MSEEIKLCPFCHGKGLIYTDWDKKYVFCPMCKDGEIERKFFEEERE